MDKLRKGFSILNGDVVVGVLPTPRTLRIAKALGYATVLHDCGDGGTDAVARGVRQRVEAARHAHHAVALAATGSARETVMEEVRGLDSRLPKPPLVVSADPHHAAARMVAATAPDGGAHGPQTGSDQPGKPQRRRAA